MSVPSCKVAAEKPHAVCIPVPFQGHLKPLLTLAKLLHHRGFHITFVNTESNHMRILQSRGPNSLDGLPDFRFETIPDGLPLSGPEARQEMHIRAVRDNFLAPFVDLIITKLNRRDSGVPPVTCIFADGVASSFTYAAGELLGIPVVGFFTASAGCLMGIKLLGTLKEKGYTHLKGSSCLTSGYLDTIIDNTPGMRNMRLRDLPSLRRTTDPDDLIFDFSVEAIEKSASNSSTPIIINTFDELEQDVLTALAPMFSDNLYTIGPIHLLLNQIPENNQVRSIGFNLWKEDLQCLSWLHSKMPGSVVYVSFGSLISATPEQLVEFAWGLADSQLNFLWVIRPDLAVGNAAVFLPEFEARVRGQGLITGWCAQEQVLGHASVGAFLTHCGWNSTLESLSCGVPLICWPSEGDQTTNCRYSCVEWGVGVEIGSDVRREEVSRIVREAMVGEQGKKMKKRAMALKELAREAAAPNGLSSNNLDKVVNCLLSNTTNRASIRNL